MVCKIKMAHLLAPEAIFGPAKNLGSWTKYARVSMTEIRDLHDFGEKNSRRLKNH